MNQPFEILRAARSNYWNAVKDLSWDQLTMIPQNFNNNILWNLGHVVVTQQLLCYKMSGLPLNVSDELVGRYAKGSSPTNDISKQDLEWIKKDLVRLPELLEEDYNAGKFKEFTAYKSSFGYELSSIEDAIAFNNVHEGLHLGYLMALKRVVLSST